jgi:hypothetical protein
MSKQYKITHEEASLLEYGLMGIEYHNLDFYNKEDIHKAVDVIEELKSRMNSQAIDNRRGRTSDCNSDGTITVKRAIKTLYMKYFNKKFD